MLDGEGKGDFQQIDLSAGRRGRAASRKGDALVLTRDAGRRGRGRSTRFSDYAARHADRRPGDRVRRGRRAVARLRGLAALLGLGFAFFILLRFILPALLADESPTLVSLVGSSAIMFVVLYLAHGFSARTTTALLGTLFGLALWPSWARSPWPPPG